MNTKQIVQAAGIISQLADLVEDNDYDIIRCLEGSIISEEDAWQILAFNNGDVAVVFKDTDE